MSKKVEHTGWKANVQKMGSFLSEMIMPNIGAFVAWGLITAIFIENGWFPNENIAQMIDPMLRWMLPLLVAYTAGYNVYSQKGGVVATVGSMGAIMASETPMFIAVMFIAPLTAYLYKEIDQSLDGNIKPGFEMLVNSAVIGVIGAVISIISFLTVGPIFDAISQFFMVVVDGIISRGLFPLIAIIAEPAKVLFLNNALYHGVIVPIAMNQVAEQGYSILFWTIANIGPGLGVLLAYMFYGKGTSKQSAPGAAIIHFFGGIHEMYFPFVLKNPLHLISIIASGMVGLFLFSLFEVGNVAPPALGSIFAILAVTRRTSILPALLVIFISTLVSFGISAVIVRFEKEDVTEVEMTQDEGQKEEIEEDVYTEEIVGLGNLNINKIVFACDAGQGSSAMGATLLRKKLKENNITDVTVKNSSITNIPDDTDLVVTQKSLADRAKSVNSKAQYVLVDNFLAQDKYDEVVKSLTKQSPNVV